MKFAEAFRDPVLAKSTLEEIRRVTTKSWAIMEVCGGQTHAIMRYGIDQLLPDKIELIHGPGCPVCVTPLEQIDKALAIAEKPDVIFISYGDMLRVPGTDRDMFSVRASGADVRTVYSALDAVKIARENPDKEVVFFGIGFETTAPANAMSVVQAKALGLKNYSILVSQVCVPPAMRSVLSSRHNRVQGFLAAGHVNAVMGFWEYPPISEEFNVPIVVTGFEPLDILQGILMVVRQLEQGRYEVENGYTRAVTFEGNKPAQKVIDQVFELSDRKWRGIGLIPMSGWQLKKEFDAYNAEKKFDVSGIQSEESKICIAGEILQGLKKPDQCPAFGTLCTPEKPLGATMVSSEGVCAAYYRYHGVKINED
ncbi:MAG: hydrogenase formation protein HypD [Anaerolineales bacterium]|nr:hydrogenase formation protein HypD [Anaerolineales bacterium]